MVIFCIFFVCFVLIFSISLFDISKSADIINFLYENALI